MLKTKAPQNNLMQSALIYSVTSIINAAIPFLLLPILTRYLTPAEFGVIAIFQAVVTILGIFVGNGLHGSIRVRYFKTKKENFPQYVGVCILLLVVSACLTILVGVVFFHEITKITDLPPIYLGMAFIASIAQFLIQIRLVIWQVKGRSLAYGVFQISQTLFNTILTLYLVVILTQGVQGRVTGIVVASVLFCLLAFILLCVRKEVVMVWNKNDAVSALKFGLPLIPHALTGVAITMSDRFILANKIGIDTVGLYFIALQLSLPVSILSESINRAFMPWSFKKMGSGDNVSVVAATYLMMVLFMIVTAVYAIFIWSVYDFIIDAEYHLGKNITLILLAASCFHAFYFPIAKSIFFSENTNFLSLLTVCLGAVYIVSAINLVDFYGMTGLAIAFLIYRMAMFIFVWILGNHVYPQPWLNVKKVTAECCKIMNNVSHKLRSNILIKKLKIEWKVINDTRS